VRAVLAAGVPLDGARDHGVNEAVYLRDPDGIGIELYWDRPRDEWPRDGDGSLRLVNDPLDVDELLRAGE
jgi:catechol 2,3-dioxygenase